MILTQKNRLRLSDEESRLVKAISWHCARLYNSGLYKVRQHFFAHKTFHCYEKNAPECYENENYKMLLTDIGQQILRKVDHNFKSFFGLLKAKIVNADVNGAANILVKFLRSTDRLSELVRERVVQGFVNNPVRVTFSTLLFASPKAPTTASA